MWFLPGDDLARVLGPKPTLLRQLTPVESAIQESLPNRDHRVSRAEQFRGVRRVPTLESLSRRTDSPEVVPTDLFDYLDWQQRPTATARAQVVRLADRRGAAPASMNRRIAAVRGLFEYAVISGLRVDNPVPAARRSSGLQAKRRGSLGHIGSGRPSAGGRLVREPHRLPESLDRQEISDFLADLGTYRDRAMVLLMALGGLRAAETRSLRLADMDMGLRRVRVTGKGGRETGGARRSGVLHRARGLPAR